MSTKNIHQPSRLRLQPHKHTGKLLAHHHTSFHGLLLVVALALLCTVFIQHQAQAAELVVTATVPAPIPAGVPTIDQPADGTVTQTPSLTVSGTCPVITPAIIIVIYEGTAALGSEACSASGNYSFPINLTLGSHQLVATVVTITGDYGQSSPPITVSYVIPTVPASGNGATTTSGGASMPGGGAAATGGGGATGSGSAAPLEIISRQLFITFSLTKDAVWNGEFRGGTGPYKATFFWGDGTVQKLSGLGSGEQHIRHQYKELGSYTVRLEVTDASGTKKFSQLAAVTPIINYLRLPDQLTFPGLTLEVLALRLYWIMLLLIAILWWYERWIRRPALARVATARRPVVVAKRRRKQS